MYSVIIKIHNRITEADYAKVYKRVESFSVQNGVITLHLGGYSELSPKSKEEVRFDLNFDKVIIKVE